jgi:hypothetical protein
MLQKGTPVWNKAFGDGIFRRFDPTNPRLCYVRFRKTWHGKFVQHVGVNGLRVLIDWKWIPVQVRNYPLDQTVSERAFRDFLIGIITNDPVRTEDGFWALHTVTRRATRKLRVRNGTPIENRILPDDTYVYTAMMLMGWIAGYYKNPGFPRNFGRVMRNTFVSMLRRQRTRERREWGATRIDKVYSTNAERQKAYRERKKALRLIANKN